MPDYELKTAIPKIQTHRFNFALFKGDKENQVLITSKPATPKQVATLEKEIGEAKRLAKGLVYWESNQLTFATKAEPQSTWETMVTKIFKDHSCSKFLPAVFRKLGDNESDEASVEETEGDEHEGQESPVPPVTGTPGQAGTAPTAESAAGTAHNAELWEKALSTIETRYLDALRGQPANASKMRAVMALATGKADAGDMTAALQALKALQGLVTEAEAGQAGKETDVIPGGIVAERRAQLAEARLRWEGAIEAATAEVNKVQAGVSSEDPEVAIALQGILNGYRDKLLKVLDAAAKVHDDETAGKAVTAVQAAAANLQKEIAADPVLNYLEKFPEGPVAIQSTFNEGFADVAKLLNA